MKDILKLQLLIVLGLFSITTFGQGGTSNTNYLPAIIPPSPNAASLGNYGQIPVGLFTGTPQINIPLYDFKAGKISVPVSLSYSSNGIKVDEMASDVGLGWVLNAGGVITRTIMDDGDENQTLAVPNFSNYTAETLAYLQNATSSDGSFDTMTDLYSFNFNGFSGTFYLDENKNPVLTHPSAVKIVRTPLEAYAFKITDPNGVIYYFGSATSTEKTMCRNKLTGHSIWTGEEPNSWYLSKIENPSSGDIVTFNYTPSGLTYDAALSQTVSKSMSTSLSAPGQNLVISESLVMGVSLSSITSSSGKISFLYANRDMVSNTRKIESIEIEDINQVKIKKFVLGYNIVTSSLGTEYRNPHITYVPQYGQRLFLTSVTEMANGLSNPPYKLAYYDYDKIPPRFSYAQDYWGYFNGASANSYMVSNDDYFFTGGAFSPSTLKDIFNGVGGNKKANGIYSKHGLLKTITYPTGGFNELTYEPHSYYGTKIVYPPKTSFTISISNTADQMATSQTVTSATIPFSQDRVPVYFTAGTARCWEANWPTHHVRATLTVEVAENGSDVFNLLTTNGFYMIGTNGARIYEPSPSGSLASSLTGQRYIDLIAGKRYRFKVSVPFECVRGDFSTVFYDKPTTTVQENIEVGGQRLSRITANTNDGKQEIKDYYYGTLSCLNCSSGIVEAPVPCITLTTYTDWSGDEYGYVLSNSDVLSLSSSTLYSLYTKQGSHIGYPSVIESIGANFGAGGILHKFTITSPEIAMAIRGYYVPGTPNNTTFDTGNETETQYFYKSGNSYITTKKTVNKYVLDPVLNKQLFGYSIRQRNFYSGSTWDISDKIKGYDITKYIMRSQWHYLKMTTEDVYDLNGQNPITTTKNYVYGNTNHLQLTSENTTSSAGEIMETKYSYADEMNNQMMKDANMTGIPLKIENYIGTTKLSEQQTAYAKDATTNNLLLPKNILASKGTQTVENKITFNSYDNKGNITQYTQEAGIPVAVIWGYNQTQPIAKIENATYATVQSQVANLQSSSDTGTEANLIAALNTLRSSLPNAMVTTYTYKPLIGISTITDPKGETVTYTYDSFGRLQFIKDHQGNTVKEHKYNYRP